MDGTNIQSMLKPSDFFSLPSFMMKRIAFQMLLTQNQTSQILLFTGETQYLALGRQKERYSTSDTLPHTALWQSRINNEVHSYQLHFSCDSEVTGSARSWASCTPFCCGIMFAYRKHAYIPTT